MKNIHVLPTEKPSRLWFHKLNRNLGFSDLPMEYNGSGTWVEGRNIYITSDKEIKDGDWVYNLKNMDILRYQESDMTRSFYKFGWRKIILTDNKDLIKDGVQAIDDEFLEWFVKNPTCEMVKIERVPFYIKGDYQHHINKIIIPKEEPKQEETLEEAAEEYGNKFANIKVLNNEVEDRKVMCEESFEQGAKWQQEQDKKMYSEEEVIELLTKRDSHHRNTHTLGGWKSPKEWFEQFKKK